MKRLHICLANHPPAWRKTLVDLVDWVTAGFEEAGFEVTVSDGQFSPGVPNLIFENNGGHDALMQFLGANRGAFPLICFVTEVIIEDRFDDWSGAWDGKVRYRDFLSLSKYVDGYVTMVPSNVEILRRIAPTTFFEFGFSDRLVATVPVEQWQFDYGFAGALTPYRSGFLSDISARGIGVTLPRGDQGAVGHTALNTPVERYLGMMRSTAINLCLKQHAGWRLPSLTRLARIGHSATGCALELTPDTTRQSALFPTFNGVDDFLSKFVPLDRARIRSEATERMDIYRSTIPLRREVERNLDECPALGGLT